MVQALALLRDSDFRNETAPWFERYANRMLYRKLGYTSNLNEILADEADWFSAIDSTLGKAQQALQKQKGKK